MNFRSQEADAVSRAREKVGKAITEFVQAVHDARIESPDAPNFNQDDAGQVYVLGFAAEVEYLVPGWVIQETTGNVQVIPDDQTPSYSRGLFERGADTYAK